MNINIADCTYDDVFSILLTDTGWNERQYMEELTAKTARGLAARIDGCTVGVIFWRQAFEVAEITMLAVAPAWHRRGIARLLLKSMLKNLCENGAHEILLEVRVSNTAARSLYLSAGFVEIAWRSLYYANPDEDALVMSLRLS